MAPILQAQSQAGNTFQPSLKNSFNGFPYIIIFSFCDLLARFCTATSKFTLRLLIVFFHINLHILHNPIDKVCQVVYKIILTINRKRIKWLE